MPTIQLADKPTLDAVYSLINNSNSFNMVHHIKDNFKIKRSVFNPDLYNSNPDYIYNDNKLYTFTTNRNLIYENLWVYDYDNNTWNIICDLKSMDDFPKSTDNIIIHNNEIHILSEDKHWKFDGKTWTKNVSTLPFNVNFRSRAISYNGNIHLIGGATGITGGKLHYSWDGSKWSKLQNLPYSFGDGCVTVHNEELHILSSDIYTKELDEVESFTELEKNKEVMTKHYKYNTWRSEWVEVSTLPDVINFSNVVSYNNCIYITNNSDRVIYMWNNESWKSQTYGENSGFEDYIHYMFVHNDQLICIGHNREYDVISKNNYTFNYTGLGEVVSYDDLTILYNNQIHTIGSEYYILNDDFSSEKKMLHFIWNDNSQEWSYCSSVEKIIDIMYSKMFIYNNEIHVVGRYTNEINQTSRDHYKLIFKNNCIYWENIYTTTEGYNKFDVYDIYFIYNDNLYGIEEISGYIRKYTNEDGWIFHPEDIPDIPLDNLNSNYVNKIKHVIYNNEIHLFIEFNETENIYHIKFNGTEWIVLNDNIPFHNIDYKSYFGVYNNEIHAIAGDIKDGFEGYYHYKFDGNEWHKIKSIDDTLDIPDNIVFKDSEVHFITDRKHYVYKNDNIYNITLSNIEYLNEYNNAYKHYLVKDNIVLCDTDNVKVIPEKTSCEKIDYGYKILEDDTVYIVQNTSNKSDFIYSII